MAHGRARDVQKQRVYEFEEECGEFYDIQGNQLSLYKCQQLVNFICAHHGVHPPKVTDGRGRKSASADTLWIRLPKQFRNLIAVVHECSHVIVNSLPNGDELAFHGPLFVRYVIEILIWIFHVEQKHQIFEHDLLSYASLFDVEVAPSVEYQRIHPGLGEKVLGLIQNVEDLSCELDKLEIQTDKIRVQLEVAYGNVDVKFAEARQNLFP